MTTDLLVINDGATRTLVLNRPTKRNAISNAMLDALIVEVTAAQRDDKVQAIVLTGAGQSFSGGRDRNEIDGSGARSIKMQDGSVEVRESTFMQLLTLLIESPKPTIAAVRGVARAGGQAITLACDFVVAERGCVFGNPEMLAGFPAAMNTVLLARHLGRRKALEIAISGAPYTTEDFVQLGLVNRVAEPGMLEQVTAEFVASLNHLAPWAVRRTKEVFRIAEDSDMRGLLYAGNQMNHLLIMNGQIAPLFRDKS